MDRGIRHGCQRRRPGASLLFPATYGKPLSGRLPKRSKGPPGGFKGTPRNPKAHGGSRCGKREPPSGDLEGETTLECGALAPLCLLWSAVLQHRFPTTKAATGRRTPYFLDFGPSVLLSFLWVLWTVAPQDQHPAPPKSNFRFALPGAFWSAVRSHRFDPTKAATGRRTPKSGTGVPHSKKRRQATALHILWTAVPWHRFAVPYGPASWRWSSSFRYSWAALRAIRRTRAM